VAWILSVLLIGTYLWLPTQVPRTPPAIDSDDTAEPLKVDVVNIAPAQPYPGGLLIIDYINSPEPVQKVFLGKEELHIVSQRNASQRGATSVTPVEQQGGTVVARLPNDVAPGRAKVRVGKKGERSKPYDIRIEARDWRLPFRDFLGGLALLIFGIGVFARGAGEAAGKGSAETLQKFGKHPLVTFGFGAALGGLAQSTVAAAAFLAGVTASSLLTSVGAAAAFIGAQVGTGIVPLATGLLDPRVGLVIIALGVLWLGVAKDRRTSALARLALGAGLVAYGLHLLRGGIEPLVVDKTLLRLSGGLQADTLAGVAVCVLIGAVLVAFLQGAASALFVIVGLMQTTGQLDLRVVLAVLAGSGLGAGLSALLTTRGGAKGRKLSQLHLLLGALTTLVSALTVKLWATAATGLVPGHEPIATFGANTLVPHLSAQLVVAIVLSQVASALAVLPMVPLVNRWLKRAPASDQPEPAPGDDAVAATRSSLLSVLRLQREAMSLISGLVLAAQRALGRDAEHCLSDARTELDELLGRVVRVLPNAGEGLELRQLAFACLQFQRSLEDLLFRAERFTDRQVALSARGRRAAGLAEYEGVTREMHQLLLEAVNTAIDSIEKQERIDQDAARAREIRLNALEAQSRRTALESSGDSIVIQVRLDTLEVLDAYERAGNHMYRLAETLTGSIAAYRSSAG
jgi:Na+/phosphate symporter